MAKEYYEREAAISELQRWGITADRPRTWMNAIDKAIEVVKAIPAADVRENKRGRWKGVHSAECSECGHVFPTFLLFEHYCPSCGAEMERVE